MEGAFVLQIIPYISRHDRSPVQNPWWYCKYFNTDVLISSLSFSIGNPLSLSYAGWQHATIGQQEWQADWAFPIRSDLLNRQQRSYLGRNNASRCVPQESQHQVDKDISIGSCLHLSTGLQGNCSSFFIHTDPILASVAFVLTNFHCCISIPVHRQGPEAQVSMPPSPVSRRGKVPRVPDHKQSARRHQHLLLPQYLQSWWNLLLLLQKLRHSRYLLLSHKKNPTWKNSNQKNPN